MVTTPDISIIGPGKVGTALGVLAARAGWRVAGVGGRSAEHARAAADAIASASGESVRAAAAVEAAGSADLVLLTVPDDLIADVCSQLAAAGAFRQGGVVAHCSGALPSAVLAPARDACGCRVGSMHPLQTFPTVDAAVAALSSPGTHFFLEGDAEAAAKLDSLVGAIGGRAVAIDPAAKPMYHAAAAVASNGLVVLLEASLRIGEAAGIARGDLRPALAPLVRTTLENVLAAGPGEALTGPVARGDAETVARHLAALGGLEDDINAAYRAMGRLAARLALSTGRIDDPTAGRLRRLLGPTQKE